MNSNISIRRATTADADTLDRLAALDSTRVPAGSILIAEVADEPHAAIEVESGTVIANPFQPTNHLAELLSVRARNIRGASAGHRTRRHATAAANRGHRFRVV